jgi:hypothetical protein
MKDWLQAEDTGRCTTGCTAPKRWQPVATKSRSLPSQLRRCTALAAAPDDEHRFRRRFPAEAETVVESWLQGWPES